MRGGGRVGEVGRERGEGRRVSSLERGGRRKLVRRSEGEKVGRRRSCSADIICGRALT